MQFHFDVEGALIINCLNVLEKLLFIVIYNVPIMFVLNEKEKKNEMVNNIRRQYMMSTDICEMMNDQFFFVINVLQQFFSQRIKLTYERLK